jgi:hypothetical protein
MARTTPIKIASVVAAVAVAWAVAARVTSPSDEQSPNQESFFDARFSNLAVLPSPAAIPFPSAVDIKLQAAKDLLAQKVEGRRLERVGARGIADQDCGYRSAPQTAACLSESRSAAKRSDSVRRADPAAEALGSVPASHDPGVNDSGRRLIQWHARFCLAGL